MNTELKQNEGCLAGLVNNGRVHLKLLGVLCLGTGMALPSWAADAEELDPFMVASTATRSERLLVDLPIRTEVLRPELFRSVGAFNLASGLEYLPGVRVESNCQNCGTAEVKLLGLGAGYNQLLFNGQPLFSGLAAVYGLEHIPTAFIERVEVVKGGASTLYGPGAVAGVINIIPREPLVPQILVATQVESFKGRPAVGVFGLIDYVRPEERFAATVFGEWRKAKAIDLNDDGFSDIVERDYLTSGTNFWLYPSLETRISGNYAFIWEERRGGDHFGLPAHETQITEQLQHHWHRGGLDLQHRWHPQLDMQLTGSFSHIRRDSYYGGVGDVALPGMPGFDADEFDEALEESRLLYGFTRTTRFYFDSRFAHQLPHRTLSWGVQFLHDNVFDEKRDDLGRSLTTEGELAAMRGEDPIADGSFSNTGIYVQDEWDPSADWTLITGVRADRHSELSRWIYSPRAAVRFTPNQSLVLRGSIATGFRAPEIFDEDFHIEILEDPTRVRNAGDLREERSTSYAAGFIWMPNAPDNRWQFDVEFYHTDIRNTFQVSDVVFTDVAGNAFKLRENAGRAYVQGFEANALYRINSYWTVQGGVTLASAQFKEAVEILDDQFERRFIESPRWSGVAQLNYRNAELFDWFLGVVYTGPMIAVNQEEEFINRDTGHFFVVDTSFSRSWSLGNRRTELNLTAGVRNLFDERQTDLPTGPERDAGYFYGPRFPRSFFVTAALRF